MTIQTLSVLGLGLTLRGMNLCPYSCIKILNSSTFNDYNVVTSDNWRVPASNDGLARVIIQKTVGHVRRHPERPINDQENGKRKQYENDVI